MLWGFSSANATLYRSSYDTKGSVYQTAYTPATINNACPSYQFRTTSVYTTVVDNPSFSPIAADPYSNGSPRGHIRRGTLDDDDDDPDENGIGIIDNPVPVGSPFILLLMALLYLCGRVVYKRLRND